MENNIKNYPQGFWETNGKIFINKYQALLEATRTKSNVYFKFFPDVWDNFDVRQCGKRTLNELYKLRAEQLRDKYDYLILYFSGGADSHNVLRSFIDNDIRLDEVCVKWPKTILNNYNIYEPSYDNSSYNYLSEWDYAIKPVLDEIKLSHPHIKITIVDWFEDPNSIGNSDIFSTVNHWHDIEISSLAVWSPSERDLVEKGKKVGSIYGIDKPKIFFDNEENVKMFFIDSAVTMGTPNPINVFGCEYFYWTPDMPELAIEAAIVSAKYILSTNDIFDRLAFTNTKKDKVPWMLNSARQAQETELRHVLYTTWTNRFQANKPVFFDRRDKCWWLFTNKELNKFKNGYKDMFRLHAKEIDDRLFFDDMYAAIPTRGKLLFKKGELNDK
ncbi:hypothetical protein EBU71_11960 [bacterium]|nr:hypothetical protein [Candidatus Elulimicrobium humile]